MFVVSKVDSDLKSTHEVSFTDLKAIANLSLETTWSPIAFYGHKREQFNFKSVDLMVLDVDEGCTLEEAKELFKDYQHIIVTTRNHQKDKHGVICDRFRVMIPLSATIKDPEVYKSTWNAVRVQYPFIDKQCKDLARLYYSSKDIVSISLHGKTINPSTPTLKLVDKALPEPDRKVKGKLSKATLEFIVNGAKPGERNITLFKAAKDMQEQNYTEDEAYNKLKEPAQKSGLSDTEISNTIGSAFKSDPKYQPRDPVIQVSKLIAKSVTVQEPLLKSHVGGAKVHGPEFWDATQQGWRKGEVLGMIGGSGSGKSACSLKIVSDAIDFNPDDIHFFFTLEMPARQIIERWNRLIGTDKHKSEKLFVIEAKDVDERIGWQDVYRYVSDTCEHYNMKPGVVVVDHFQALSDKIDMTITPNFNASPSLISGKSNRISIEIREQCRIMKKVAETLNCFLLVQNQTTKEKGGQGDFPLGIDAAYGSAHFEWFCDYILTIWQPLKRVQAETPLSVTGWQYAKIREIGAHDQVKMWNPCVLFYDVNTGDFRPLSEDEKVEFDKQVLIADERRKASLKKEGSVYSNSVKTSREFFKRLMGEGNESKE